MRRRVVVVIVVVVVSVRVVMGDMALLPVGGKSYLVHGRVCAKDGKALLPEQSGKRKARRSSTDDGDVNCEVGAVSMVSPP